MGPASDWPSRRPLADDDDEEVEGVVVVGVASDVLGAGSGVDGVVIGVVGLGLVVGMDTWELLLFRQATSSPDLYLSLCSILSVR